MRSIATAMWSFWRDGRPVERAAYSVGAALLVSGLIHLTILVLGGGSWDGPVSLRKPSTFGLSFGLTLLTIAWVSSFLRLEHRTRSRLLGIFTIACVLETALVSLQAWRGVPSHFNVETTFDGLVARLLAAGGVTLVAIIAVMTLASFRANPTISPGMRVSIRIGLSVLLASQVVGALMIAKGMTFVFAGDPQAAYATGGTLKPTHAVTMHAILVLPFVAWLLSLTAWDERRQLQIVLVATTGFAMFAGVTAVSNFAGVEPDRLPIAAIAIAAIGLLLLVGAGMAALLGGPGRRSHAEPTPQQRSR